MTDTLQLVPLGGCGEFGMNMMALRWGDDILLIDAGMMFPDEGLHGVDVVIPDLTFVQEHRERIRGLILTHAHEDHIGALPYVLKVVNAPVFGTRFTLAVAEYKLEEHGLLREAALNVVEPGRQFTVGAFGIEFIRTAHSTIDSLAVGIETPVGLLVHATDFKLDETPVIGGPTDLERLRELGDRGVLMALIDSTNAERTGRTPSEKAVIPALEEIFESAPGRIIVSCFASSIHRIQIVLDLAYDFDCQVALIGKTMVRLVETSMNAGYLDVPDGLLVPLLMVNQLPREKVVMLATGCQGEPMAALSRMATGSYKQVKIEPDDTIVLSARIIPGNEKAVSRLMDHIYRRGGHVIDETISRVHVSGHPSQDDLKLTMQAVRPRYLIPIHGDYRRLSRHREYAISLGLDEKRVIVAENGDVVEADQTGARLRSERVFVGRTFIDEAGYEEIEEFIIRDRRHLAEDGFILPIVTINETTGKLEDVPEVITRGFVGADDSSELLDQAREVIIRTVEGSSLGESTDWAVMKEKIRVDLKRFITKGTNRRPLIIPVIIEI
jgi:ribonuclease J